ncbi:unnamed protein product [Rhizophagus irregularis]|nr:unnamed protein product [Rhizophagus irregularis]CAB5361478.1 unnamed protein product [Rhizophagus irregularis]
MSKVSQFDNSTLELYYSNLNYLFNFLQPHLDVNVEILKDEDEEEYKKLLTTSVINADTTKKFPQIMKEHQGTIPKKDTCLDITINQAIAILVNRIDKKSATNVMRFGFTKPRALNSQGFSLTGINSTVDYMRKSRAWLKFYTRIGQEAMVFLLTNFSIFLELQNGCYVQLTGPAINKLPIPRIKRFENIKKISETAHVLNKQTETESACIPSNTSSQNSTSSTCFSSQNEEVAPTTFTQDVCTSYQSSDGSYNLCQNSLPDDNVASQKSMLSQDINSVSKRKSDVLAFFRKLRDEEDKTYSKSYASSSLDSQSSSDHSTLFSSQNTSELSSQTTTSSLDDLKLNDKPWVEVINPNKDTNEDMISSHIEQKIGDESMASNFTKQETGDTASNYTKFKEQTKGTFLKIMEAMHPVKVTEETSNHDECIISDKNKNPENQKKRRFEDVQETSSNAIILNNRKKCVEKASNNAYISNECSVVSNENNEIQKKRPIEVENPVSKAIVLNNRDVVKVSNPNSLSNLCFSRSVMFLSSPIFNKYGTLWYGLPKEHILNVAKFSKNNMSNIVIYHIFPRQFGLKNVFTKKSSDTSLYIVYLDRKKELSNLRCEIPNRLQHLIPYVKHIIERHNRCQYKNLLNKYCPIQDIDKTDTNVTSLSYCNNYQVVKFVIGVLDFIIPPEFWGSKNNKTLIYKMVGIFIERRRFEVLSLHEVLYGFKVNECKWLVPPGDKKSCNSLERMKRVEVLHEFIWWVFECFVIPLLKLNFHITHNAKYKCRLFYYRQEVWLKMFKQGFEPLKSSTFEEIPTEKVTEVLNGKTLGYSKVKFIPKDDEGNLRPIVNMKCPMHKTVEMSNRATHKDLKRPPSINSILNTTYQILNYEKENNPLLLNGSIFSYNEVHERLKKFKQCLADKEDFELYFAKVDVKCCFDSIDHDKLMEIIRANVLTKTQYVVNRYDAVHPKGGNIRRNHKHYVHNGEEFISFPKYAVELAQKYKNAILIENVKESYKDLEDILELLEEHIQQNIIKVEDKFYTQKVGIPQGSMLSSLLCSIYYGVMEQSELQFIKDNNGILLHLLDDFLYISTNKANVIKFITVMHRGNPEYRCIVNNKKSMVNFDLEISGEKINKVHNPGDFPWCGLLINTHTLNVKADYSRYVFSNIADTLTVKTTKNPGEFLKQRMIEFMTTKCHWIFYDTSLNTRETTLLNIYQNFLMVAMKFHSYIKEMPKYLQRNEKFEAEVVHNTIKSAYDVLCKTGNQDKCTFNILKEEVIWLGIYAFLLILNKKQNFHQGVLTYLKKIFEDFHLRSKKLLNIIVDLNFSSIFSKMKF